MACFPASWTRELLLHELRVDATLFTTAPITHGPGIVSATKVGPAAQLPFAEPSAHASARCERASMPPEMFRALKPFCSRMRVA